MTCDDVADDVVSDGAEHRTVAGIDRPCGESDAERHTPGSNQLGDEVVAGNVVAECQAVDDIGRSRAESASADGRSAERPTPGSSGLYCVGTTHGDTGGAAECCGEDKITRTRGRAEIADERNAERRTVDGIINAECLQPGSSILSYDEEKCGDTGDAAERRTVTVDAITNAERLPAGSSGLGCFEARCGDAGCAAKRCDMDGIACLCIGAASADGHITVRPPPGRSGLSCVGARGGNTANANKLRAVDVIARPRNDKASAHPMSMREGVVPFCLESLSAQDNVDSGDKTTWSVLQVPQIRDVDCEVAVWLERVEYAIPHPPKKPGGCVTD